MDGGGDTFSMMTSFSGINGVAQQQQLYVELSHLATLIPAAFPQLRYRGSVSYQPMPCIPLTLPLCKHSDVELSFIKPCNGSQTLSAGYHISANV